MAKQKSRESTNPASELLIAAEKPWLDPDGKRIPPPILKIFARTWDLKTWNEYLDSFEEPLKEKFVSPKRWSDLCEKTSENIFDLAQSDSEDELFREISSSVKILPAFHRQVIRMTYWHNMSVRAIAQALGISKSSVHRMIGDAQSTLQALIHKPLGHFALNEGTNNFKKETKNDQDISA